MSSPPPSTQRLSKRGPGSSSSTLPGSKSPPPSMSPLQLSHSGPLSSHAMHTQHQQQQQPVSAAEQLIRSACPCPLESFVNVLPAKGSEAMGVRRGVLRYLGPTDFADGVWAGVELVGTLGRNNGFGKSHEYFKCLPGQGVFVKPELVQPFTNSTTPIADGMREAESPLIQSPPMPPQRQSRQSSLAEEEEAAALALMEELESKLLAAEKESDALRSEVARLTDAAAAAATATANTCKAAEESAASAEEVATLKAQLDTQHRLYAAAEKDWAAKLAAETERRTQAEANLASLLTAAEDESTTAVENTVAEQAETVKKLNEQVEELKAAREVASANSEVAPMTEVNSDAHAELTRLQDQLAVAEQQKGDLSAQLKQVQRESAEAAHLAQQRQQALEESIAALKRSDAEGAHQQEMAALQERLTFVASEKESLARQVSELSAVLQTRAGEVEGLRQQLATGEAQTKERVDQLLVEHQEALALEYEKGRGAAEQAHRVSADTTAELVRLRAVEETLQSQLRTAQATVEKHEEMVAALSKERDELQEMCDLQEEELNAEKAQSDELSQLLKTLSEDHKAEKTQWQEEKETMETQLARHQEQLQAVQLDAQKWRRQCQLEQERVKALSASLATEQANVNADQGGYAQLQHHADPNGAGAAQPAGESGEAAPGTDEQPCSSGTEAQKDALAMQNKLRELTTALDAAQLQIFQLKKSVEATAQLQEQYNQVSTDLAKARQKAKRREEALTRDYEEALEHVRGYKDRAQQESAQLRTEVARLEEALAAAQKENAMAGEGMSRQRTASAISVDPSSASSVNRAGMQGEAGNSVTTGDPPRHSTDGGTIGGEDGGAVCSPGVVTSTAEGGSRSTASSPLSDYERDAYEATILRLQRQLLSMGLGDGARLVQEQGVTLTASSTGSGSDLLDQMRRVIQATEPRSNGVMDFSSESAQAASTQAFLAAV